jgi:hypothetical protein
VVAFVGIAIPDKILTIPIMAAFAVSLLHFVTLYRLRVPIAGRQTFGAVLAAMSVQWTVARAVGDGLIKEHLPFARTAKGGRRRPRDYQASWETIFGGLLILGAIVLVATNVREVREINIFAAVLVLQSLPFLAAAAMAAIERTRMNEFAYWKGLEKRLLVLWPKRAAAIAKVTATATTAAATPSPEKEPETVQ